MTGGTQKDGGQAFPRAGAQTNAGWSRPVNGMTLRDWFAGQALVAMGDRRWEADSNETGTQKTARAAYSSADAMIAERGNPND